MNKIVINYDTLCDALQEYFNARLVEKPVIRAVGTCFAFNHSSVGSGDIPVLEVNVQENGEFLMGRKP